MPKRKAPESLVFHVRIPKADRDWLFEVAERYGVDAAQVIRWAIEAMRKYVDANNGRVHLPIDFREVWKQVEAEAAAAAPAEKPKRKEA
jgi:hypothetical protein